jgi:hypothetical protein
MRPGDLARPLTQIIRKRFEAAVSVLRDYAKAELNRRRSAEHQQMCDPYRHLAL